MSLFNCNDYDGKDRTIERLIKDMDFKIPTGKCYNHEYLVSYSDISSKGTLKHSAAVNYCQNLAVLHSDAAGYTLDWFEEQQQGWILISWHIIFGDMPKEGVRVNAETWTGPHKLSQANREFALIDEEGQVFMKGASRWVLMNTARRRPAKLDKDFFKAYSFANGRQCGEVDYTIDFPEDAEQIGSFSIPVMRRDTDTNDHANNAVYIDWALDGVPDEIYDNMDLTEMIVTYKKECRRGDQVLGTLYKNDSDILCVLTDEKDPKKEFGRILMNWQ